jgi:ABC-type multidrug transport system fused ATPase/permease subunit
MGRDCVTQDDVELAAKNANAHDFIMTLPDVTIKQILVFFVDITIVSNS